MVDVLNDASDEAGERERRRVQEPDGERHPGGNPLGVPQSTSRGMGLERGNQGERNCREKHKGGALFGEATVTCTLG